MDLNLMLKSLVEGYPLLGMILMGAGSLVAAGTAYVAATKSQKDDAVLAKIEGNAIAGLLLRLLVSFSVVKRKND